MIVGGSISSSPALAAYLQQLLSFVNKGEGPIQAFFERIVTGLSLDQVIDVLHAVLVFLMRGGGCLEAKNEVVDKVRQTDAQLWLVAHEDFLLTWSTAF